MNTDTEKLRRRLRMIRWMAMGCLGLTALVRLVAPWSDVLNGLLIGEVGGLGVVWSMTREGHLRDNLQGTALMLSGAIGYATRMVLLVAVIIIAIKLPHANVIAALAGYLLGFVFVVAGLSKSA